MRRLLIAILLGLLLGALFVAPARAVDYSGGSAEQRAYAQAVVESCAIDYALVEARLGYIGVQFVAPGNLPAGASGLATPGSILVSESYHVQMDYLAVIVAHEWAHQIWYALPWEARLQWMRMCQPWVGTTRETRADEHFAEVLRWELFPCTRWYAVQTMLRAIDPIWLRFYLARWLSAPLHTLLAPPTN